MTGLKQQLSTDKQKNLSYRKYRGSKLTEMSWRVTSKVWGWHQYLDVDEKLPAVSTVQCSQEKPQPFRQVKLRKSEVCSSHVLPRETHALEGWRTQPAKRSGPELASLAWAEDDASAPTAKAGMSTSLGCSCFDISKNTLAHTVNKPAQSRRPKQNPSLDPDPGSPPSTAHHRTLQRFKVLQTSWTLWLHLLIDWIEAAAGLTSRPRWPLQQQHHQEHCCSLTTCWPPVLEALSSARQHVGKGELCYKRGSVRGLALQRGAPPAIAC